MVPSLKEKFRFGLQLNIYGFEDLNSFQQVNVLHE